MAQLRTYKTFTSILIILVLGLVAYIAYSKFSANNTDTNTAVETQGSNALSADGMPLNNSTTPKIDNTNEEISDTTDSGSDEIAQCVATTKKDADTKGTKYEKGSILVSFKPEATFTNATDLLAVYKLKIAADGGTESEFKSRHWLTVAVPTGDEFKYICTLKTEPIVKNAVLNTLFSIHY